MHWVGLFPSDFIFEYEDASWVVDTYEKPSLESDMIGTIEIQFSPENGYGSGLSARYNSKNVENTSGVIEPHIHDSDWGYGPYFHITVLEINAGWVKLQLFKSGKPVWANFGAAFGANNIAFHKLNRDNIYTYDNEGIVVEQFNNDSIVVRDEQPVDMSCGDESFKFEPYQTRLIQRSRWIDENGRSRFNVPYTRGC